MGQEIEHLNVKLIIGAITLVVGFVAAGIALFQGLEKWGVLSRYVLGLAGFAAMILGTMLIRDAWGLRNVLEAKSKSPTNMANNQNIGVKRLNTILPTKIVERKIIVLKSRLNLDMVKLLAWKLKGKLFVKMRFLKPKPEEIRVVSIDKHYEPYIVVGGKYAVDYYKKHVFPVRVHDEAAEIALFGKRFKPKPIKKHPQGTIKIIELEGEALFHYEDETYFVLDKMGREVSPEHIPIAPSEQQSLEKLPELDTKMGEVEFSRGEEIDFLRSRVVKRPSDGEVSKEIFEVNERTVIYSPMYELTFQNVKTGKKATVKIDGVTGEIIPHGHKAKLTKKPVEDSSAVHVMNLPIVKGKLIEDKRDFPESTSPVRRVNKLREATPDLCKKVPEQLQMPEVSRVEGDLGFQAKVVGKVLHEGDNVTVVTGDLEIPSGTTVYETLMVKGCLKIGTHCQILAKVEALKDIMIGANTEIEGNVVSGGNVIIGPDSFIRGSVKSDGHIEIAENAVIKGGLHSKSSVVLNRFAKVYGRA